MPRRRGRRGRADPFAMAILTAPPSTSNRMVFKWDRISGNFDISHYNPAMSQNRLSMEKLEEINQSLSNSPEGKIFSPWICALQCCPFLFLIAFVIAFPIFMVTSITSSDNNDSNIWTYFPYIMVGGFLGIFCIILCPILYAGVLQNKRYKKREEEFKKILDDYNQRYQSSEISFRTGKFGAYFMVDFEFMMKQQNGPQGGFNMQGNGMNQFFAYNGFPQPGFPQQGFAQQDFTV